MNCHQKFVPNSCTSYCVSRCKLYEHVCVLCPRINSCFLLCVQDVMMKIISFSQQGPRAICILSANGVISSVTLRQPDSSGGTLTYEVP